MNRMNLRVEHTEDIEAVFISDDYYFNTAIKESNFFLSARFEFIDSLKKIKDCHEKYFTDNDQKKYVIAIENLTYLKPFLNRRTLNGKKILFVINTPLSKNTLSTLEGWICSKYLNLMQLSNIIKYRMLDVKKSKAITLTTREKEMLSLYTEGVSLRGIAMEHGVSVKTVYSFKSTVINKMEFSRKGSLPMLKYIRLFNIH